MNYWRRKIAAYLHECDSNLLNLLDEEKNIQNLAIPFGFDLETIVRREADWSASAADRLPWPRKKLDEVDLCCPETDMAHLSLKHPLGQSTLTCDQGFESKREALKASLAGQAENEGQDARKVFLRMWRFWQHQASEGDARFACLPADPRLPDHTIWNHLSVTSAMQGCLGGSLKDWQDAEEKELPQEPPPDRPAFLLFTIGPVQDFIAAARNTRDLWSGSYLLSYLMGTVLKQIALDFGPDHVIFPNLANQPILDLLLETELWSGSGHLQERPNPLETARRLTPSLPNRFLAILPSEMKEHEKWQGPDGAGRLGIACYAAYLEDGLRRKFVSISESVAALFCNDKVENGFDTKRFLHQAANLLEIHWEAMPWPSGIEEVCELAERLPKEEAEGCSVDTVKQILEMVKRMPPEHRDPRKFKNRNVGTQESPGSLREVSNAWSALYALAAWRLDAVKATRAFTAWGVGAIRVGFSENKDSLNGKEEVCLAVPREDANARELGRVLADNTHLFKPRDRLGASTLIKRLWHYTWLSKLGKGGHLFEFGDFSMPNTRSIADHLPFAMDCDEETGSEDDGKYFAVLALDGDEMGKWVSGLKCPELKGQVPSEVREYFLKHENKNFLKARRPLSPSFHLQFSELLGNFSLFCARRIVESFDGRLIYAGGDDVLALLPADTALACARALRAAFRGEKGLEDRARGIVTRQGGRKAWKSDQSTPLFKVLKEGFLCLEDAPSDGEGGKSIHAPGEPVNYPFMTPGPATDCSVGIAIAHFKAPLQDVVREAQKAEKRAKGVLGRGAVAVTTIKRGGEINLWGFKWGSGGYELFEKILNAVSKVNSKSQSGLSAKFPHRVIELLEPYLACRDSKGKALVDKSFADHALQVVLADFRMALDRQSQEKGEKKKEQSDQLEKLLFDYWSRIWEVAVKEAGKATNPKEKPLVPEEHAAAVCIEAIIGLCRAVGFACRTEPTNPSPRVDPVPAELEGALS